MNPNVKRFLERKEVKLALSYLLLLGRPHDNFAYLNILPLLEGFGKITVAKIKQLAVS